MQTVTSFTCNLSEKIGGLNQLGRRGQVAHGGGGKHLVGNLFEDGGLDDVLGDRLVRRGFGIAHREGDEEGGM
eukprot:9488331-Pyramimonas_sp.AAC.1